MEQQHKIRKSFFNFVLGRYFTKRNNKKEKRVGKYKISDLSLALDNQHRIEFWTFLTYDMPYVILSEKMDNCENYFSELNYLLNYVALKENNGHGYFKGCFKLQKNKLERHYNQIIGKQLLRLHQFEELVGIKKFGKQYYVKLIKHIMQKANTSDEQAKEILMNYIDSKEIRNQSKKKEYVKNVIRQLKIQ